MAVRERSGGGWRWVRAGAAPALVLAVAIAVPREAAAQATLSVEPDEASPGDQVHVEGTDWCCEGNSTPVVDVGTGDQWGTAEIHADGFLTADLEVPEDTPPGPTELQVCDSGIFDDVPDCASAGITIVDPDPPDTEPDPTDPGGAGDPGSGPPATDTSGVPLPTSPTAAADGPVPPGLLVAAAVLLVALLAAATLLWRRGARRPRRRRRARRPRATARAEPGPSVLLAGDGGPVVAVTTRFDPAAGSTTIVERRPP